MRNRPPAPLPEEAWESDEDDDTYAQTIPQFHPRYAALPIPKSCCLPSLYPNGEVAPPQATPKVTPTVTTPKTTPTVAPPNPVDSLMRNCPPAPLPPEAQESEDEDDVY